MTQKTKPSFEEFEAFKTEQERKLWKWLIIGDLFFLLATLILVYISEEIFKLKVLSWPHYWLLFGGNLLPFGSFFFSLIKNFKVWLIKYFLAIYVPLLISAWIYFTDPEYTKVIFAIMPGFIVMFGVMFYDIKPLLLSAFVTAICFGLLFFHYSKIGALFSPYEIYLLYMFLVMLLMISFPLVERIRFFLAELLQKRKELEEERASLQIKVKARTQELEELTKTLDEKVKERTKELQERINQLERFSKLTIGRELRMAELKKEIEKKGKEINELREELKEYKK